MLVKVGTQQAFRTSCSATLLVVHGREADSWVRLSLNEGFGAGLGYGTEAGTGSLAGTSGSSLRARKAITSRNSSRAMPPRM
jgi:hypothetical protein